MLPVPRTLAFFHAHPDDEALLTAGTMARAAAEGNRVVLVTATSGEAGLADARLQSAGLGQVREEELRAAATALGVHRLELLHYADSGLDGRQESPPGSVTFCRADPTQVAQRLADVLRTEAADILVVYDESGGYGHPDHIRIHTTGLMAADIAATSTVYAATAPREPFAWTARAAQLLPMSDRVDLRPFLTSFTPRRQITHRVDVRPYIDAKRAAMRAHASQATGADVRTLGALLRLPKPVFAALLGTEYYRRLV
jgi:LmbE family N-acetylglucosaminyl deacetylase